MKKKIHKNELKMQKLNEGDGKSEIGLSSSELYVIM